MRLLGTVRLLILEKFPPCVFIWSCAFIWHIRVCEIAKKRHYLGKSMAIFLKDFRMYVCLSLKKEQTLAQNVRLKRRCT